MNTLSTKTYKNKYKKNRLDTQPRDNLIIGMKNWIQNAIKKPGALRKTLGIKQGKTIPTAKLNKAIKGGGVTGRRAALAKTLKKF